MDQKWAIAPMPYLCGQAFIAANGIPISRGVTQVMWPCCSFAAWFSRLPCEVPADGSSSSAIRRYANTGPMKRLVTPADFEPCHCGPVWCARTSHSFWRLWGSPHPEDAPCFESLIKWQVGLPEIWNFFVDWMKVLASHLPAVEH